MESCVAATKNWYTICGSSDSKASTPYWANAVKHTLSLFTFWSPDDSDFYVRPIYAYRHSDRWSFTAGANLFGGSDPDSFFGQFEDAANAYLRVRFHY